MRQFSLWSVIVVGILAVSTLMQQPARAQVNIQLGGSSADIKRMLNDQGYSDITILKKSFTATTAEGCLNGVRYRVKILITGQTKWRQEVGRCRSEISIEKAKRILVKQGYDRIDIEQRRGTFVAIACLREERLRVSVDRYGDVRKQRRIGRCRSNALSPTDIAADLKKQGYTRIKFIDRQLPRYVAEACLGLQKYQLVIAGDGNIRKERNIGDCRRAISPRDLPNILKRKGFARVKIIDNKLPRYVVEACRRNRLIEVTLNRFGKIIDQYELGRCAPKVARGEIVKSLQNQGVSRIKVISENEFGYVFSICRNQNRVRINFNPYGDIIKEEKRGSCKARTLRDITKALQDRQFKNLKFFAEGCRRGRRVRVEFNRFGDPVGRKRLGAC